jgi:uncharacterized protein (TIGR02246 family)
MSVSQTDRNLIENLYKAMEAGAAGENAMLDLFAEDAVFVEPFGGEPKTHTGLSAIRTWHQDIFKEPMPDMRLQLDRVDLDVGRVRAAWTCYSSAFSEPMRGIDYFTIEHGKIQRLEIVITHAPPMTS